MTQQQNSQSKIKLLVTGGSGFIGSHTILALLRTGKYEISVFDDLICGHEAALKEVEKATGQTVALTKGNLLNYSEINNCVAAVKPEAVVHFAALIQAGKSMQTPTEFFENNISGSINLIKSMQTNGVKKIVFSSTAAVYGDDANLPIKEDADLKPESWYGYSKLVVENLLRSLASENALESEKVDSVILRYFNATGSDPDGILGDDHMPLTHLIPLLIQKALGIRDKFTVYGTDYPTPDGTCIRDYIHVADLASAHVLAVNYVLNNSGSDMFNVATGKGSSVKEVISALKEIHGEFELDYGARRPGDPAQLYADCSKIKQKLGWEPKYSLKDSISHLYSWFKQHPKGYGDKGQS